jgi:hypothetical protein
MRSILIVAVLFAADDRPHTFRFLLADAGRVPAGWASDQTGTGAGSVWKVVADGTAPSGAGYVLAQTAESPSAVFNLCVAQDTSFKDGEVRVAFKAVQGKNDQGGGLVWRYRDHDNYYVCRMNPLENNFRVYKVVGGKRQQLQSKEGLAVRPQEWHRLKVRAEGDHVQCFLDDEMQLDVRDGTFRAAGKVGLWTKADAQTFFDDLQVFHR